MNVPLVECENEFLEKSVTDMDYYGKYYCPDFKEEDKLINNYYYTEYSWMRWTIERCQDSESAVPCASKEEIDKFAYENIVVLQSRFGYLNLQSQDSAVKYNIENLLYSSAQSSIMVKG